jgi:hypothetical protein
MNTIIGQSVNLAITRISTWGFLLPDHPTSMRGSTP